MWNCKWLKQLVVKLKKKKNITKKKESQAPSPFISYKNKKSQGQVIKNNNLIYECTFVVAQTYGTKIWSHIFNNHFKCQSAAAC